MGPAEATRPTQGSDQRRAAAPIASLAHQSPQDRLIAFENNRLQLIQKSVTAARIGLPVLTVATGGLFSIWIPLWVVVAWALVHIAVSIVITTTIVRMSTVSGDVDMVRRRMTNVGLLLALNSGIWALMPLLFWAPGSDANHLLIFLLLAGALPMTQALAAPSMRAFSFGIAPLLVALLVPPLVTGGALYYGMASFGFLYGALMVWVAVQQNRTLTTMLQVKEHNADLLVQVARAKAESDAARYRAERLNQAKSTFLANMSHELRTPLNAILGFSEVIQNEMLGPIGTPTYKSYAGDIHTSGRHLLGLINDILDLSRIEAGRLDLFPVVLSVPEIIGDACKLVENTAAKSGVRLVKSIPDGLPYLRADERAMRQIVLNLLSNAVKFTKAGGTVTVSARLGSSVLGPKGITVTVEDTGIGIKKEDLSMVLEAFGQVRLEDLALTTPREQGTGLGLPIVRGLLEAHGGRFVLESEFGTGTRAFVHLPGSCVLDPKQVEFPPSERTIARRA